MVVFRLQFGDGFGCVRACVDLELGDADIAVIIFQDFGAHALHLDSVAGNDQFQRFILALAHHGQGYVAALGAAHDLDRIVEAHALHRLVVELDDQVAGFHARLLGWRVVDGGDDFDETILHAHFYAEAAEFAGGIDL